MLNNSKILVVDDNQSILRALELLLNGKCKALKTLSSPNLLLKELKTNDYDILLLDMNFSAGLQTGNEGIFWLKRVLEIKPDLGVIMITAFGDIELAVKAVKNGAIDFVLKPWNNDKLLEIIDTSCRLRFSRKNIDIDETVNNKTDTVIGASPLWNKVMETVKKVALTDANVLITGENGTGKELIAKEIHNLSLRRDSKMITVDMGSISENLFESELFGHKKGAFTDAHNDRIGKMEEANGGTLFFDEIGNMPISLQVKLLSALQNRTVTRVGDNTPIPVDIRLISATNQNINNMVEKGIFRKDLLYRINTISIELPPLRDRKEDIPALAVFFLKKYCKKYKKPEYIFSDDAMKTLENHHWTGNVRELEHTIERAVILCENSTINSSDFMHNTLEILPSENYCGTLEEMEKKLIADAVSKNSGNFSLAAAQLGISRQTLYNKMKKHGL